MRTRTQFKGGSISLEVFPDDYIQRHGYRRAQIDMPIVEIEYGPFSPLGDSHSKRVETFQKFLAERCSAETQNHECYRISRKNGTTVYVQFSDWIMKIGVSLIVFKSNEDEEESSSSESEEDDEEEK